ncbi:hypothetical protein GCM10022234_00400 [Aeromicrobium panaciterrae]|uniref:hypothetical protein n=1 Tax=Aeromicrobium panaciterrae TaxID=363861 RepID=UPI0031DC7A8D
MRLKGHLGWIEADDQYVTIGKKLLGGNTAIPIAQVEGFTFIRADIGLRAMRVMVAGTSLHTVIRNKKQTMADPYTVMYRSGREDEFRAFADVVMAAKAKTST